MFMPNHVIFPMNIKILLTSLASVLMLSACCCRHDAQAANDMAATAVTKKIAKGDGVSFSGRHVNGGLDLTSAGSGLRCTSVSHVAVGGEIVFVNCVFDDDVLSYVASANQSVSADFDSDVTFIGCVFQKGLDLRQSIFRGRLDFEKCVVRGAALFDGARFLGGCVLNGSQFESTASFDGVRFGPGSSLRSVKFDMAALFQNSWLESDVMFTDSHFAGVSDFSHLHAAGGVNMSNCQFGSRVECRDASFLGAVRFSNAHFAGNVIAENTFFLGTLNLNKATFDNDVEVCHCVFTASPDISNTIKADTAVATERNNQCLSRPINILQ